MLEVIRHWKLILALISLGLVTYLYWRVDQLGTINAELREINSKNLKDLEIIRDDYKKTVESLKVISERDRNLESHYETQQGKLQGLVDAPSSEILKKAVEMTNAK
jgi:hypothetical protein